MLEKIYLTNLMANEKEWRDLEFPQIIRYCRELYGLKQYACSDFLGFEQPRYKKLELGRFSEPVEAWEMERLVVFFQLPDGMLQKKQKEYLTEVEPPRREKCTDVWNEDESTRGERSSRAQEDYTRERGVL